MAKKYFTTGELADLCSVSPVTIFRAINNHSIQASTTPGGHFRIEKGVAEEFLKRNNIPLRVIEPTTKKILIVEDNLAELRFFERVFHSDSSFEVKGTVSGYKAGFLTESFKPDLILLDIFLEDVDGREVATVVRSEESLKHTKILAITGTKNPKEIAAIRKWGFDGVLLKPVTPVELKFQVERLLK